MTNSSKVAKVNGEARRESENDTDIRTLVATTVFCIGSAFGQDVFFGSRHYAAGVLVFHVFSAVAAGVACFGSYFGLLQMFAAGRRLGSANGEVLSLFESFVVGLTAVGWTGVAVVQMALALAGLLPLDFEIQLTKDAALLGSMVLNSILFPPVVLFLGAFVSRPKRTRIVCYRHIAFVVASVSPPLVVPFLAVLGASGSDTAYLHTSSWFVATGLGLAWASRLAGWKKREA